MAIAHRHGARVFFEDVGSGGPPIVFIHGLGNHEHFAAQIEHFSRGHRVIAPDLPGFGRSEAPADREYTINAFGNDIAWLCEQLQVEGPVVMGHSMGGAVALELAAAHPTLASAVVLLDPLPIVAAPMWRDGVSGFAEALRGPGYREAIRGYASSRMFRPADDQSVCGRIVEDMCATPQHVICPLVASIAAWRGETVASLVKAPLLLITAGDGIPSDMARIRELLPAIELGRTVGSGHFAHLLVPDQVDAMIERFLIVSGLTAVAA